MKASKLVAALAIVLVIGVVAAVTLYSATLSRTQEVYGSELGISIDPDPFPDLVLVGGEANHTFSVNVTNPATNPSTVAAFVTVNLTSSCGSANVTITEGSNSTDLCTSTFSSTTHAIAPGGFYVWTLRLDYEDFIGAADYEIEAEGTT